jgi:hypothetical protein
MKIVKLKILSLNINTKCNIILDRLIDSRLNRNSVPAHLARMAVKYCLEYCLEYYI